MNQQLTIEEALQDMENKKKQKLSEFTFNQKGEVLPWEQDAYQNYERQ